jgi:hypothetical protein
MFPGYSLSLWLYTDVCAFEEVAASSSLYKLAFARETLQLSYCSEILVSLLDEVYGWA